MRTSPAGDIDCTTSNHTAQLSSPTETHFSPVDQSSEQRGKHTKNASSSVNSYSQRDSRVHSIYDRYLYSREQPPGTPSLLRKASSRRVQLGRLNSIKEMPSPSNTASAQATMAFKKKRQSSVLFAPGTKGDRGQRESQAWAGMMMNNVSSDDSDSDDSDDVRAPRIPPPSSSAGQSQDGRNRASWSSRAAAVGSRPPDSASQNPPTLKLLGLRSVKDGGAPMGGNGSTSPQPSRHLQAEQQQQSGKRTPSPAFDMIADQAKQQEAAQRDRIASTSDYGDELDRHGSYIDFGGADGFGGRGAKGDSRGYQLEDGPVPPASSSLQPPKSPYADQPLSPRTALTQQLGLVTPQSPAQSPGRQGESYFPPALPSHRSASGHQEALPRSLLPASNQGQHLQQRGPPQAVSPVRTGPPAQSIDFHRGAPPNGFSSPQYRGQSPAMAPLRTSPGPTPMPVALPSPVRPNHGAIMMATPAPFAGGAPQGQDPSRRPTRGPGFSDSPQVGGRGPVRRQPSMLRRSMAFFTGNSEGQQGPSRQQQQGGPNNSQRRSLFRRSMAFITGRSMPPPPPDSSTDVDDADAPQPRVNGFVDEKPKNRKSEYLGASGMGDEWDYSGYGAKFWKRFSVAQRKEMEGANKDSDAFRRKTESRRKWIMCMSLLGGVVIISAVVAIVIWRESVTTSDIPGAVDRQRNGVNAETAPNGGVTVNGNTNAATDQGTVAANPTEPATSVQTRSTSTRRRKHRTKSGKNRREATPTQFVEEIKRSIEPKSIYYGGIHPLPRGHEGQLVRRRRGSLDASHGALVTPAPQAAGE